MAYAILIYMAASVYSNYEKRTRQILIISVRPIALLASCFYFKSITNCFQTSKSHSSPFFDSLNRQKVLLSVTTFVIVLGISREIQQHN